LAIKESTLGIEALKFNTPISKMMEFVNSCKGVTPSRDSIQKFLQILSPYAPHLAEELWERLEFDDDLNTHPWPEWDEGVFVEDEITVVVQIKGKVRARILVSPDAAAEDVIALAKAHPSVQQWIEGKTIKKEGYIPRKLVFLVPV
jgi:leucyl-tRNA synthetase